MSGGRKRPPAPARKEPGARTRTTTRGEVFRHGKHEYSIVRMPADGNCLFHSLAYCLRQSVAEHLAIRRQAVEYVAANWSRRFGPVLGAFLQDHGRPVKTALGYSNYMRRFGVFGGDPELCAISEIYGVRIEVFVKSRPDSRPHVYNARSRHAIVRLLFSGSPDYGHYDVVMPVGPEDYPRDRATPRRDFPEEHSALVSAVDYVLIYTLAFSTLLLLLISFLAIKLSLPAVKH